MEPTAKMYNNIPQLEVSATDATNRNEIFSG